MIPGVGSEVDAFCTRCKMDLMHRVVAVVEARPKRVECLTCHSQHNYRKAKAAPGAASKKSTGDGPTEGRATEGRATKGRATKGRATKARAPRVAAARGTATERARRPTKGQLELAAQWETRVGGKGKADFARYSVKQAFSVDQLLDHATFGQGFVSEVHQDRKISVVFRDGEKVLAHARG